jgi:hypothetical protein
MRNIHAKLTKLESLAASLPRPSPAPPAEISLRDLNLPVETLRALLQAMRQHTEAGGAEMVTLGGLMTYLPVEAIASMEEAVKGVKKDSQ